MARTGMTGGLVFCAAVCLCSFFVLLPGRVQGCSLVTKDWEPRSLENRTATSPVVVAGTVLATRRSASAAGAGSGGYAAEVAVEDVYKGYPYFNRVGALPEAESTGGGANVYAIGGFGPAKRCLAQVRAGRKYIMFLTPVPAGSGRGESGGAMVLMARYDDIFGAAVEFDERQEKRVHRVVGWREWALWSPCSVTCGVGVQVRRRMCAQDVPDACEGAAEQSRRCNSFACRGVKDLLQLMSLSSFPPGVRRSPPRRSAYHISSQASLSLPLLAVFPAGFPAEFSILLVVKPPRSFSSRQNDGYLYAMLVTDSGGGVSLGVQLGATPALVHQRRPDGAKGRSGLPDAVSFPDYQLQRRRWNTLAFSVRRGSATLHAECSQTYRVALDRNERIRVGDGRGGDISIGNPKANMVDMYFEGDLEQLMVIDDPDAAALQCSSPMITHLTETPWPSINVTKDVQGDMDILFHLPGAGDRLKPQVPISGADEQPIKSTDPLTTSDDATDSTDRGSPTATEEDPGASPTDAPPGVSSTAPVPPDAGNRLGPVPDRAGSALPEYGAAVTPGPAPNGIDPDPNAANDIVFMPDAAVDDTPVTLGTETMYDSDDDDLDGVVDTSRNDVLPSRGRQGSTPPPTRGYKPTIPPTSLPAKTTAEPTTPKSSEAQSTTVPPPTTLRFRLESARRPENWGPGTGRSAPYNEPASAKHSTDVLENWSTWSTCSRTCGTGTRYRFTRCRPGSRLRDCKTGRGIAAQTQTCHRSNCRVPALKWSAWSMCSRTCGDGVEMRMAYCYDNTVPGCENGQKIVVERKLCRRRHCFDVCKPSCKNGGTCRPDRTCACPSNYVGNSCETELCSQPCLNGGQCIAKNFCQCPSGYKPPRCTAVCNPRCQNGGTCKAPFECACPPAFTGKLCESAACKRPCRNGGACTGPNTCTCTAGYQGQHCEQAICEPACRNGGTCARPGFCRCPPAYRGRTCQITYCRVTCRNGGRCSGPDTCTCPAGFGGAFCQRRLNPLRSSSATRSSGPILPPNYANAITSERQRHHCRVRSNLVSYQRSYVKPVARTISVRCGPWQPVLCTHTRMEYETAYRTFYRIAYRRQCSSDD